MKVNKDKKKSMKIQSLLFSKDKFSKAAAIAWAKKHGYKTGIDEKEDTYRMRQFDPSSADTFRTIPFKDGVKAIVAKIGLVEKFNYGPDVDNLEAIIMKAAFSDSELEQGIEDEKEHAKTFLEMLHQAGFEGDPKPILEFAFENIARDHLDKLSNYYSKLKQTGVEKDKLTTEGRKHIKETNFALPPDRYPIHDISHARNALARASGKSEEAKVKAAVYAKYPSLKPDVKKDTEEGQQEGFREVGGLADNTLSGLYDMQQIVSGIDYEMQINDVSTEDEARTISQDNLSDDPDFYRKRWLMASWAIGKDEDNVDLDADAVRFHPRAGEGLSLDLGSGQAREPGHLGVDVYPYDYGTLIHDLTLGLPFEDESATSVRLVNALDDMNLTDPKPLLSEIQRVLMPGGQFYYEGPNVIDNYPEWMQEVEHDEGEVEDIEKVEKPASWVSQKFMRVAYPDNATANDSEPRIGVAQYDMLPADALLAMDAMGYYWSDATTSGRGNRAHGYPSQGALVSKSSGYVIGRKVPIFKINKSKQLVYGVVLSPNESDLQEDFMLPDDIEKTAHEYLKKSRVVGSSHEKAIDAYPVESYIAPQDFDITDSPYGPQLVKKGAWILGIKISDPKEWQKVADGEYQGFSVGGLGLRDKME